MRNWFHKLKISQKLALISVFFVMPDSVMLYLFITGINTNIEFARMEQKGNQFQRPLEELLEQIPQHRQLALRSLGGDPQIQKQREEKQAEIDAAFDALEAVNSRIGAELQFTEEGLAKRKREHYRPSTVREEWRDLVSHMSLLTPAECAEKHDHLKADIRVMITHAGDMSNLILDPDLDSYYLMDATLLALPQTQDRLAEVMAHGEAVLGQKVLSNSDRQHFAIYATLLKEADLDRISGSIQTALNEDPNFYGISPTLQSRIPPPLKEYMEDTDKFIRLTEGLVTSPTVGITAQQYLAAGRATRDASFNLWRIADEEVDTLLQKRIESYQWQRTRSLLVAGCALLAAIGFVTFITRSISGPLRQQASELQATNDALQTEIAERSRIEAALRTAEEQYRGIFENAVEGIYQTAKDGHYLVANPTLARMYGYASVTELQTTMTDIAARLYVDPARRAEFERQIALHDTVRSFESQVHRKDGTVIWISENARAVRDTNGALSYYEGKVEDITERKKNEAELQQLHRQLVETSRNAGMAEVATGVLHNVGNVLNSVNVSAMLITDRLAKSKSTHVTQISALLREHAANLAAFFTSDPKGKKLPEFIHSLAIRLSVEQRELLAEAEGLRKNIGHIKDIVSVQQNYAKVSGIIESLPPADLVEDALQMNAAAFDRHNINVVREFDKVPDVRADKHKVLQILVNVVRNAKFAVSEKPSSEKRISVRLGINGNNRVKISVVDNGIGIAPENLTRIFAHGFTTRKDGHGFGLHTSALAARELGGSLTAHSGGPGMGATFTLELPVENQKS